MISLQKNISRQAFPHCWEYDRQEGEKGKAMSLRLRTENKKYTFVRHFCHCLPAFRAFPLTLFLPQASKVFFVRKGSKRMSFTLWFTGLSGAGKTTLSQAVYYEIRRRGLRAELLDGDIIRSIFSQDLRFTRADRDINVKRIGFVSHLLTKNQVVSVVAAIAPYSATREVNRRLIGDYVEVFCDSSLETVIQRDAKGLYKRALAGEIPHFTGVSDPYEAPAAPDIHVHTDRQSVDESVCGIIDWLERQRRIPQAAECTPCDFTPADEEAWRERLAFLGYR